MIVPLAVSVLTLAETAATIATTAVTVATSAGCDDDDPPKVDAGPPDTPIV